MSNAAQCVERCWCVPPQSGHEDSYRIYAELRRSALARRTSRLTAAYRDHILKVCMCMCSQTLKSFCVVT